MEIVLRFEVYCFPALCPESLLLKGSARTSFALWAREAELMWHHLESLPRKLCDNKLIAKKYVSLKQAFARNPKKNYACFMMEFFFNMIKSWSFEKAGIYLLVFLHSPCVAKATWFTLSCFESGWGYFPVKLRHACLFPKQATTNTAKSFFFAPFSLPGPLSLLLFLSLSLSFSLCLLFYGGLDAVQIVAANWDCLTSHPSFSSFKTNDHWPLHRILSVYFFSALSNFASFTFETCLSCY